MNKKLLFSIILVFISIAFDCQAQPLGKVYEYINSVKSGDFDEFQIFNISTISDTRAYSNAVEQGLILDIDTIGVNTIINNNHREIRIVIPLKINEQTVKLDLVQNDIFSK